MGLLPSKVRLTRHAIKRLDERGDPDDYYNRKNLMNSSCKWYNRDDFIPECALYKHSLYVCRKTKQLGYITDGKIEVVYNKTTGDAITILEVKDKFKPITQYIKPGILAQIKRKKEIKKMAKRIGVCPDCGKETELMTKLDVCVRCNTRRLNAESRGRKYIPYIDLSDDEKALIDRRQTAQTMRRQKVKNLQELMKEDLPNVVEPIPENYYEVKATQNPAIAKVEPDTTVATEPEVKSEIKNKFDPLSDQKSFIAILEECGCGIPEDALSEVLEVLTSTDKLKDIFMIIAKNTSQQAILDLEQALNVVERKLQHTWEYNGFQEVDDIKFKGFLMWRRVLKGSIFFWKKLYQTNALIEMERAWNAYTADPNEKVLLAGDKIESSLKRYQITTDSISTIFNTRRPFTRVFYAKSKEEAHEMFVKWMAERQLHEDKSKTTIIELSSEGKDGREKK